MKKVLEVVSPYLIPILEEFEKENSELIVLYKKCVEQGYKDTYKAMLVEKEKVKSIESYSECFSFCLHSVDNYTLVKNRIILLSNIGCCFTDKLMKVYEERTKSIEFLREIAKNTQLRIKFIKDIDGFFPTGIMGIPLLSLTQLLKVISGYKYKRIVMQVVEYILKKEGCGERIKYLEERLSYEFSKKNKVEYFFSVRPTGELKKIFVEVMEKHQMRLKNSSAYVEDRMKDIELRIISFLEYIDKKINNKEKGEPILIFVKNASKKELYDIILSYGKDSNYDNSRVKSKVGIHHQAKHRISTAITFLKDIGVECGEYSYVSGLKVREFLCLIENKSELLDWNKRRVYEDREVESMLERCDNIKDKLMITILREVGLRNAAICALRIGDLVDEYRHPRHLCRVKEKGNKIREFVTSKNIKEMVVTYLHTYESILKKEDYATKYIFSRTCDLSRKMGSPTLNNVLKRIAIRGGITDVNVQAHTFRHTLVGKLIESGNSIHTVSKFIGHKSVDTTMTYYWLKDIEELSNELKNPFTGTILSEEEENDEITMLNSKIDACFKIIGMYKEEIETASDIVTLKGKISESAEQINNILKYIAESVDGGDTSSILSYHIDFRQKKEIN